MLNVVVTVCYLVPQVQGTTSASVVDDMVDEGVQQEASLKEEGNSDEMQVIIRPAEQEASSGQSLDYQEVSKFFVYSKHQLKSEALCELFSSDFYPKHRYMYFSSTTEINW